MHNEPLRDPRIVEAMEACRAHSNDLAEPDLAFLADELAANPRLDQAFERLQQVDATVQEAFHDVAIPEGLEARILDRLRLAEPRSEPCVPPETAPCVELQTTPPPQPIAVAPGRANRVSRRWLLAGAGSLTAGLALSLISLAIFSREPRNYRDTEVLEVAMGFFDRDASSAGSMKLVREVEPPSGYAVSRLVRAQAPLQWRYVEGLLDRSGVAYELGRPGGPRATLYVIRHKVAGLPSGPGPKPALSTHNRSVSAWQSGPLLYVLVVDGGPRTYRSFLDLPRGPVA